MWPHCVAKGWCNWPRCSSTRRAGSRAVASRWRSQIQTASSDQVLFYMGMPTAEFNLPEKQKFPIPKFNLDVVLRPVAGRADVPDPVPGAGGPGQVQPLSAAQDALQKCIFYPAPGRNIVFRRVLLELQMEGREGAKIRAHLTFKVAFQMNLKSFTNLCCRTKWRSWQRWRTGAGSAEPWTF